jgi:hypothetical protein
VPNAMNRLDQLLKEHSVSWSRSFERRGNSDDQWRYSPDRALASLTGFMIVFIVRCGVISSTIDLF